MLTLQDIELFLDLLRKAAIGVVDFDEAIIGQDGYGFVFRDTACPDGIITSEFSHLRYPLGHFRYNNRIKAMLIPTNRIIRYIGAVKTLVPSLVLGGSEIAFETWLLTKTPDNKIIPLIFYYGRRGYCLGGWNEISFNLLREYKQKQGQWNEMFTHQLFDLSEKECEQIVFYLLWCLGKIPLINFKCTLTNDYFYTYMTYENDKPNIELVKRG